MSDELITLPEAATLVGKNLRTIQRYLENGVLTRHEKDGKNFISRSQIEQKFSARGGSAFGGGKFSKRFEEKPKPQTKSPPHGLNYEEKWIEEIQKHAQTREELGEWKGRAEAYQSFAARLLGNGSQKDDLVASEIKRSSKINFPLSPVVFYLIIGLLILGLVIYLLIVIGVV